MGFCDYVTLKKELPQYGVVQGSMFQSKSLYAAGEEFTIIAAGKLVEHCYRYEDDPKRKHPAGGWPLSKKIHVGDKVIDYHGDILLYSCGIGSSQQLVARFTHGYLEWLRSLEEYPDANRTILIEQGAR